MRTKAVFLSLSVGVALVLLAACGGSSDSTSRGDDSAAAVPTARPAGNPNAPSQQGGSAGENDGGISVSNSIIDRKIERQATLEITAENIPSTVAKIEAAAGAVGGFVSQATITQALSTDEDEREQQATVQIRVPAEHYTSVMAELRGLAKDITSEKSTTQEVTAEYTDLQAQLRNLQATEAQYLTLLERAASIDEILTVQDRLNTVQGQIENVQGRIALIDNLTAMATITINIAPPLLPANADSPKDQNWAQRSWSNSWEASKEIAQAFGIIGITVGVLGVWLLVPGAIGLAGWRVWERTRKREAPTA